MAYDLITDDGQFQLGAFLIGPPAMVVTGVSGLGVAEPKTQDVTLDHAPGAYAGPDYEAPRVVIIDALILSYDDADPAGSVMGHYRALCEAWAPSLIDLDLYGQLPGWGLIKLTGRPRGFADDLSGVAGGVIPVQLTFAAPDPTITFLEGQGWR